ncbi:MAG TPA: PP2C family protein-serine/threonine phosphatase [Vicinamibacteria bacterium]
MSPPSVPLAEVSRMLRQDALHLGLGVLLVAVGLAAAAAYLRRRGRGAPLLAWFGLFSLLYGLRLLARTDTFPLLFDVRPRFWDYLASAITYVIPVPVLLMVGAVHPRWRRAAAWGAVGVGAFAAGAILSDVVRRWPDSAITPNNILAIAFVAAGMVLLFRPQAAPSRERRILRLGLTAVALTAVVDNLRGLGLLAWPTREVEPLGSTVLIACLGAIAVRRALDNAERLVAIDKELQVARRIQASILPGEMPRVAGLAVAARYHPMTAVAGDFYDFLELGPGRLGVLVADVSGHGVPAALIASMVKVAIAAQRARGEHPQQVLAGMNETLCGRLGGQYVTAAYLFLDRDAGLMRYGAAGHPPLLRWRPGDPPGQAAAVSAIEENGLPLGLMDDARYGELEQGLAARDRFLLYTDGLVEAANARGEFFGVEGVAAAVAAGNGAGPAAVTDRILEASLAWGQGAAADDLTVLMVDCV